MRHFLSGVSSSFHVICVLFLFQYKIHYFAGYSYSLQLQSTAITTQYIHTNTKPCRNRLAVSCTHERRTQNSLNGKSWIDSYVYLICTRSDINKRRKREMLEISLFFFAYFFICILHRIVNIFYNSCSSKTTTVHGAPLETVIRLMHIHSMPHKNCIPQHSKLHDRNLNMFTNEIHLPINISYFFCAMEYFLRR